MFYSDSVKYLLYININLSLNIVYGILLYLEEQIVVKANISTSKCRMKHFQQEYFSLINNVK